MELTVTEKCQTLCLNMIVKNEEHIILDTLENLCDNFQFHYWVISDTGSTDNTKQRIRDFFSKKNIPGDLVEHDWVDFGYNRSKALECAYNKTDYLLIFDADDSIVGKCVLPEIMDSDKYMLKFGKGFTYIRPLLINNRKRWCFKAVLHEYLCNMEPVNRETTLDGNYHIESGRLGNRSKNPNKYYDDAVVLKNAFEKEIALDYGLACRYAFYCAQSYKDAGEKYYDESIEWYKKCLDLKNWDQEKYYSCLSIGNLYNNKKDATNALHYWLKTIEYDIERMEGISTAMTFLRLNGQNMYANALYHRFKDYKKTNINFTSKLFVVRDSYNDDIEYNNSISAFYVNDHVTGYGCCKIILKNNIADYHKLKSSLTNMKFYKDLINKDEDTLELFYIIDRLLGEIYSRNDTVDSFAFDLWNLLFLKNHETLTMYKTPVYSHVNIAQKPQVFLSFTTCKRLNLFQKTVNSILNHWLDIDQIDYWFCVDDNSSDDDRAHMCTLYPWIDYYMKRPDEIGHRESMNIIWNKMKELGPVYWIHMEDDFLFHVKRNYIGDAIRGLGIDPHVRQVLFNRNYGEIINNYSSGGHKSIQGTNEFVLHEYKTGGFNYPNCHYWPHYSFRPSLIVVQTIMDLGNYDSANNFFEIDYANKWNHAGYKSAFFNQITCRHIGRLTSERNDKSVPNAYTLNNIDQFSMNNASPSADAIKSENMVKPPTVTQNDSVDKTTPPRIINIPIKIINLERRKDRKIATIQKLRDVGIEENQYEFISAVDGMQLVPTMEIKKMFEGNDFGNVKGAIGCALSHYRLWKRLVEDTENEYYLVMEDDCTLGSDFKSKITALRGEFTNRDVIFLGYHMFSHKRKEVSHIYNDIIGANKLGITSLNKTLYIGGFFAYSINKAGAQKMISYIEKNGIKYGIDYLMKIMDNISCSECQPQIVFSIWNENGISIDTDIQNNYVDKLDFSTISDDIIEEIKDVQNMSINSVTEIHNTTIYIGGISGLGNNMFQIALAIYYKEKYNSKIILDKNSEILKYGSSKQWGRSSSNGSYIDNIFNKFEMGDIPSHYIQSIYNDCYSLNRPDIDNNKNNQICIQGYCQNVDLIFDIREKLLDYFCFDDPTIIDKYSDLSSSNESVINVMLGIRIGPDGCFKYSLFNNESYQSAIDIIINDNPGKTINIYVMGDVVEWKCVLAENSTKYNIIYVGEEYDIQQMQIGLRCSHFILSDSTFHWWIAFLRWGSDPANTKVFYFKGTDIDIRCLINKHMREEWIGLDIQCDPRYIFFKKLDGLDNDIKRINFKSVPVLKYLAEQDDTCIAFNTLGFLKGSVNKLQKSVYFKEDMDGVYIKKTYYENNVLGYNEASEVCSQPNFKFLQNIKNKDSGRYCFIHSCHILEKGLTFLDPLIERITKSGLLLYLDNVFIINIGIPIDVNTYKDDKDKIKIINFSDNILLYEMKTLNLIHTFCETNNNCDILYIHTKGITNSKNTAENVLDWVNMMLYFLVDKYEDCFKKLETYDTLGCNYMVTHNIPRHFSGNYWWAKSQHIKNCRKIFDNTDRYVAEWWIFNNENTSIKYYELHKSTVNHYRSLYPPEKYVIT